MKEDTLKMLEQLNEISESVEGLKLSVQRISGDERSVQGKLTQMWEITQELERSLTKPEVIARFRKDAVDQVEQAFQLISETRAFAIDDRQIISIGFACELAAERIRKYLNSARRAARKAIAEAAMEA